MVSDDCMLHIDVYSYTDNVKMYWNSKICVIMFTCQNTQAQIIVVAIQGHFLHS